MADSNKFKLNVGSTYQYNYEAETRTSLQGASSPASVIGLTAKVLVHVESKCELILKVRTV
ncbi:hypothetical protein DPMN_105052 [Dreissena polymorpha]|uniref:Vitellogenin domain-containing protein n=1 Tax=Dreissena polymorpha TaxID=45954 RepID=A0A9D4HGC0_DREPO|nr:hypothetical protein DPMN_105052 [Dreissena polymorpha]